MFSLPKQNCEVRNELKWAVIKTDHFLECSLAIVLKNMKNYDYILMFTYNLGRKMLGKLQFYGQFFEMDKQQPTD